MNGILLSTPVTHSSQICTQDSIFVLKLSMRSQGCVVDNAQNAREMLLWRLHFLYTLLPPPRRHQNQIFLSESRELACDLRRKEFHFRTQQESCLENELFSHLRVDACACEYFNIYIGGIWGFFRDLLRRSSIKEGSDFGK